jgi:hypothetical protein
LFIALEEHLQNIFENVSFYSEKLQKNIK